MYYRSAKLRFQCTGCGGCCYGDQDSYIAVSAAEAEGIRAYLGVSAAWFRRRYLSRVDGIGLGLRIEPEGRCVFLDKTGHCRIYARRPAQCRSYPFWPELVASRGAWQAEARRCEGIGRGPGVSRRSIEGHLSREVKTLDANTQRCRKG
jgi:Fe-S-cluster containining protein